MIKDNTGEPRTSVSQRWQTSLLDLSKERLIFFQNTSDPQNISECGVFFLTDEWEMNLMSSENTGEKNPCLPNHRVGREFAEDFSNLQLAKGLLFI